MSGPTREKHRKYKLQAVIQTAFAILFRTYKSPKKLLITAKCLILNIFLPKAQFSALFFLWNVV